MKSEARQPEHSMALVRLQLSPQQTAVVEPLIRRARQIVGPTGERRTATPSVVLGEVAYPSYDASNPSKDMTRVEFRCGIVSPKAARKIRKILQEEAGTPAKPAVPAHTCGEPIDTNF